MRLAAGYHHPTKGFYFLHFLPLDHVEEWLQCADFDFLGNDVFNWDGDLIPITELSPTVIHLFSLDKLFNRLCPVNGRCANFVVKVPRQ